MSLNIEAEVKLESDPSVLAWSENLFVGSEDGFIREFDSSLKPGASWRAHAFQPYAIAAGDGRVYSSSNDGGVKVWNTKGSLLKELPNTGEGDISTLKLFQGVLYTGDENGHVMVIENDEHKAQYHVLEEVKDILLSPPFMFTVRDLDVTVTEIKPGSSKSQFMTRHTMEGRSPIGLAGSLLILVARDGKCLRIHKNSIDTSYELLQEIKASEMILTCISVSEDCSTVWTAGWDGKICRWKVEGSKLEAVGEIELGGCINALVCSKEAGVVYAAVAGGRVVRVRG